MTSVSPFKHWSALLLGLLLGCRSEPAPQLEPPRASASSSPSSTVAIAPVPPSTSLQAAATASAEPTPSDIASAAPSASAPRTTELPTLPGDTGPGPFNVALIGSRDEELRSFSVGKAWVVGNYHHYVVAAGDELTSADALLRGEGNAKIRLNTIEQLAGAWPDVVYARVSHSTYDGEGTVSHSVHRHESHGWVDLGLRERLLDGIAVTADGRVATMYTEGSRFFLDFPQPGAWGSRARVGFGLGLSRQGFTQLFAASDATLFVILNEASGDERRFLLGHFDPARDESLEVSAPTCPEVPEPLNLFKLSNGADGKVHAVGRTQQQGIWATLEGSTWHCQKLPALTVVSGVAVSSTGVATLLGRQGKPGQPFSVWQRSANGDWQKLSLPRGIRGEELGDFDARELLQGGNDDVWLTGHFQKKAALLHSRPVKRVVQLRTM